MPNPGPFLVMFFSGVAAALAWQSHGDTARQLIAKSYPQLGWLAPNVSGMIGLAAQAASSPDQQRLNTISLDVEAVRQNVDRIAITQEQITRSVDQLAAAQTRMTRNVDRLTAGQERMTRDITKLQTAEQKVRPPARRAPGSVRKTAQRSSSPVR